MKTINKLTIMLIIMSGLVAACSDDEESEKGNGFKGKHEYVDLGLPSGTLWATCNIGANSPEEYGDYFAWGETQGYLSGIKIFSWETYKWCNGSSNTLTKYNNVEEFGFRDNKAKLGFDDDCAYVNWGTNWRLPSHVQLEELINRNYTTTEWTTLNGVFGYKITSKTNGNSIFMPAAGYRDNSSLKKDGTYGYYWSSILYDGTYTYYAEDLYFNSEGIYSTNQYRSGGDYRYRGQSVRPVRYTE